MSSRASLPVIPKELLDKTASYLPTLDFNSLRLTCREIESKTFNYWSHAFFSKKQFSK
jgi:hypothetical protein